MQLSHNVKFYNGIKQEKGFLYIDAELIDYFSVYN